MKATFPHMGNLYITIRPLIEALGLEPVIPPLSTKRTLSLGTKNCPEFACLPLKLNLGNYLEAAEMGAELIVMAGGVGPCRFGYYAEVQREILRDLGYDLPMLVLEPPDTSFSELVERIKSVTNTTWLKAINGLRLAWTKALALDAVEKRLQYLRARESVVGMSDKVFERACLAIDQAANRYAVHRARRKALAEMDAVPLDPDRESDVIRIAIVGEIFTQLEPFMNLNLERRLGKLGAEVTRGIYLSQWINDNLFAGIMPVGSTSKIAEKLAKPYLDHFVGGHGQESVGGVVYFARKGFDGIIQLAPFTCMPEIVAESIMPAVSRDVNMPVMTIFLDEQTGEAGLVTRLEAFVDMLRRRRQAGKATAGAPPAG